MKKAGLFFSIILVTMFYADKAQSQSIFQKVIGLASTDELTKNSRMTSDGGQIIIGYNDGVGAGGQDFYLVKVDANGEVEWDRTYGGAGNDIGYDVQQTADGGYIIVGETNSLGAGGQDILLIKTDSTGLNTWSKTYGGTGTDVAYSVKQTFDGGYVLAGYTGSFGSGTEDIYVIKTDGNGDTTWTKTYGAGTYDYAYCIIQTADSGYAITGEEDYLANNDAFLIKTDDMGDTLWTKTYGDGGAEGGWVVIQTMDGGYALTGWTSSIGAGNLDLFLVKTDAMGDTLWTRAYGGTMNDAGLFLKESADSTFLISGYTYSFGTVLGDAYALEVDSMGVVMWSMTYGGPLGDNANSLEKNGTGGYVLGGYTYSFGTSANADYYVIHTDSAASSGACYELAPTTLTSAASSTVSMIDVTSVMNASVATAGLTTATTTIASRKNYAVAITSSTNITCNGDSMGAATVTATGGTTSYTYTWDDAMAQTNASADTLVAGTFQVMVTDGSGCVDSATVTLTEPAAIVLMISDSNHVTCNGDADGSATVSASNGQGTLSYAWDDPSSQTDSVMSGVSGGTYTCTVSDTAGCSSLISITITEPGAIILSVTSSITVACNANSSASATATASGGTGSLNYLWDDSNTQTTAVATALPNGYYTVVVTDSMGCSVTDNLSIGLLATVSSNAPICGGICNGEATLAFTGGAGSETFSWDDPLSQTSATASSLCSGSSFTGTITDVAGCTVSATVTFPSLSAMNVTLSTTDINCFGNSNGSVTAFVSGGVPLYNYWWPSLSVGNPFVNSLSAGSYDVVITDANGCTIIKTATVSQPAAELGSSLTTSSVSCYGGSDGSVNLSVTGGTSPYEYDWTISTGQNLSGVEAGIYIVDITDTNGCSTSDTATITEPSSLLISGSSSPDNGDTTGMAWVVASGGTSPYVYLWDDPATQNTDTASGLEQGTLNIIVTDAEGCFISMEIAVGDQFTAVFETSYEGSADELARDLDILSGGGQIIAGVTESFGAGGSDMYLLNSDENGNFKWAKAYGGSADDGANAVLETSDGGYILAGYTSSFGSGNTDMYVVKTDVDGVIEWSKTYGGSMDESAYSITERTNGYVIAGGTNSFGAGNTDVYVVDINNNGVVQWTATFGGADYDYGYDIESTSGGGYIIGGYTNSFGEGGADAYLIKIDASGNKTWTKVMGGDQDDAAWSVIETTNGYAFVGNTESYGAGQQDVYFGLTDASGTSSLTTAFGGSKHDYGNDITATADGGFAIIGYSGSFSNSDDAYIIKTDGAGDVIWSRTYGANFADRAWAIQETSTGELVIAGNSKSFGTGIIVNEWAYYLIKADGDGNSECNIGDATTIVTDTSDAPVTVGGQSASGGSATTVTSTETTTTPTSEILCYTSTDIERLNAETFTLGLYPNPNNGRFTLVMDLDSKLGSPLIRIYNINGTLMRSEQLSGHGKIQVAIDLGNVSAGMYYVQVISEGIVATKKVIVQ